MVHAIVSQSVGRSVVCSFFGLVVRSFGLSGRSFGPFVRWFVRSISRSAGRSSQPASHWSFGKVGLSVCQSDCFGSFIRVVRSLVCSFGRSVGWSSQPASQPLVVRSARSVDLSVRRPLFDCYVMKFVAVQFPCFVSFLGRAVFSSSSSSSATAFLRKPFGLSSSNLQLLLCFAFVGRFAFAPVGAFLKKYSLWRLWQQ